MKIFRKKKIDIFHISAQNIDCGYSLEPPRGSNEYPQPMFLSRNKKNNVYPCKPQFYYIKKWGLRGSKLYRRVFVMGSKLYRSDFVMRMLIRLRWMHMSEGTFSHIEADMSIRTFRAITIIVLQMAQGLWKPIYTLDICPKILYQG